MDALGDFRRRLYGCVGPRADALFELTDAILTAGIVPSPPHLSLAPVHRRGWVSLYAALSKGRLETGALRDLLATRASDGAGSSGVYAVDISPWPRCDAKTSPGRCYLYHPSKHSAGQPIVAGWAYQLVAGLSFERDSWVAPVDSRRVLPGQDANDVAAEQVRELLVRLPPRQEAPLFVFDAGYDPVRLQKNLEASRAQLLVRLNSGRTFYAEPELPPMRPVGRSFRDGKKFSCKDASSWPLPTAEHHARSADYGTVRVRAWSGLHPKTRRAADRYGSETAAVVEGTVVLDAYAQLSLARPLVADRRLPWELPLPVGSLTPTRVLRNSVSLLPVVGTPARAPKPRGRSPGRQKGSRTGPARRYPAAKKAA